MLETVQEKLRWIFILVCLRLFELCDITDPSGAAEKLDSALLTIRASKVADDERVQKEIRRLEETVNDLCDSKDVGLVYLIQKRTGFMINHSILVEFIFCNTCQDVR